MANPRIARVIGAVNIGSFRISAMIAGISETGEMIVLGSAHRAAQGVKRGYVTDMAAATYAVRDAIERAEKIAQTTVNSVWIATAGAGLFSQVTQVEVEIGGRRIEQDDIDHLLVAGREGLQPDGRMVLHAQPAHYTLDGAHGVSNPKGLHAERLGVDIHVMLADGAPIRNITEAVQNAHLDVDAVVGSPIATGHACLTPEERDLGVALVDIGAGTTDVAIFTNGAIRHTAVIPIAGDLITSDIAMALRTPTKDAEDIKVESGHAKQLPGPAG